jgi:hypothetical protein
MTAHPNSRPGKPDEFNTEESSLDRSQAAPFFVHRSALSADLRIPQAITNETELSGP